MVQISSFLKRADPRLTTRGLPLLNSLFEAQFSVFGSFKRDADFKNYVKWIMRSPQMIGFLGMMVSDVMSDNIFFEPMKERRGSGRNRVKDVNEYWNLNNGFEVMQESLMDFFGLGNMYTWIGEIDLDELKEYCHKVANSVYSHLEVKEIEFKAEHIFEVITTERQAALVKKFRHIPASTVSIDNNQTEVRQYVQRVGVNTRVYKPKEVIHVKWLPFDGRVLGYPPMESLLAQVYLLWLISQNFVSIFENGGHPDKIFTLPNEIAGSPNHDYLVKVLKKYKKIQNKHGNLVFTGDIEVQDLMKIEDTMQNKDLALYTTGIIALTYGIPSSRIPFLVGKSSNMGDAGGMADAAYWRRVSVWQTTIENAFNSSLFNPTFGVNLRFTRGYKQDEVRETQNEMQKTQIAEQRVQQGFWTTERAAEFLGITAEEVRAGMAEKKERDEETKQNMMTQSLNTDKNVNREQDSRFINDRRKRTELQNAGVT